MGGEREERDNLSLQDAIFLNINILMQFDACCVLVCLAGAFYFSDLFLALAGYSGGDPGWVVGCLFPMPPAEPQKL